MADIQHENLTDPKIHEPKGISTASANSVYVSNGSGSGGWTPLDLPVTAEPILSGRSTVNQDPSGVDTPLQLSFGASQSTTDAELDVNGNLTIKVAGTYHIIFVLRIRRTTNTGTATIGFRWLVNGVMQGKPTATTIETAAHTVPFSFTTVQNFNANDVVTVEILRDSAGSDDGGVGAYDFALVDWEIASSAVVILYRNKAAL